jgi:hypothetical protein
MKIKKDIALSDSGFIFNPATGESFNVNSSGAAIIGCLKKGLSLQEIPKAMSVDFDVPESAVERDVQDFMNMLMHFQLMEP